MNPDVVSVRLRATSSQPEEEDCHFFADAHDVRVNVRDCRDLSTKDWWAKLTGGRDLGTHDCQANVTLASKDWQLMQPIVEINAQQVSGPHPPKSLHSIVLRFDVTNLHSLLSMILIAVIVRPDLAMRNVTWCMSVHSCASVCVCLGVGMNKTYQRICANAKHVNVIEDIVCYTADTEQNM